MPSNHAAVLPDRGLSLEIQTVEYTSPSESEITI